MVTKTVTTRKAMEATQSWFFPITKTVTTLKAMEAAERFVFSSEQRGDLRDAFGKSDTQLIETLQGFVREFLHVRARRAGQQRYQKRLLKWREETIDRSRALYEQLSNMRDTDYERYFFSQLSSFDLDELLRALTEIQERLPGNLARSLVAPAGRGAPVDRPRHDLEAKVAEALCENNHKISTDRNNVLGRTLIVVLAAVGIEIADPFNSARRAVAELDRKFERSSTLAAWASAMPTRKSRKPR